MLSRIAAVFVCLIGPALATLLCAPYSVAQTTLGNVLPQSVTTANCSALAAARGGFDAGIVTSCWHATLSGCSGTEDAGFFYGIALPAANMGPFGTIVFLSGDGGTKMPAPFSIYLQNYVNAGYQVVEVVWGANTNAGQDWENVNTNGGNNTPNILNAACRPASLLNWIRNGSDTTQIGKGLWGATQGGMCVHANSAGGGGTAYALTWYYGGAAGAPTWGGGYIDKAILENGPVFSDISQGCTFSTGLNIFNTNICHLNSTEPGCGYWGAGPLYPSYNLEYIDGDQTSVNYWSQVPGATTCAPNPTPACGANTTNQSTCEAQSQNWYNMSIVNFPSTGQQPSFNYPNTGMSGWSCSSAGNNSAPEGQLFFHQFQSPSQTAGYSFNGAECAGNEQVDLATFQINGQPYQGTVAMTNDMLGIRPADPTLSCTALGARRLGN